MTLFDLLALIGWLSVFIEAWLMLTEKIPNNNVTWFFWAFFLFVAIGATVKSGVFTKNNANG